METIYPWQVSYWQLLFNQRKQQQLPHALLFSGEEGIGKKIFAKQFAKSLLCTQVTESGFSCEICDACHLMKVNSHPDFHLLQPEDNSQIIKMDAIRDVIASVVETPAKGGARVVLIYSAGAMNIYSANALLKTLEEPPQNTYFILVNDSHFRLLPTIVSRCQGMKFAKPQFEMALAWLQKQAISKENSELLLHLTQNAPLKAQSWLENDVLTFRNNLYQSLFSLTLGAEDPLQLANQFLEVDYKLFFSLLLVWLNDVLRIQVIDRQSKVVNYDFQNNFSTLKYINKEKLFAFINHVQMIYNYLLSSLNLNRQLLLEELFIKWMKLCI